MFWKIEIYLKLVGENRQVNQVNQVNQLWRHIYFQNWFFLQFFLREMASHPSQPSITTYMFWIEPLEKNSCQRMASHPFQQYLRHIHFGKLDLARIHYSKSPKSTTAYNTHIFENWISWGTFFQDSTSHPCQPQCMPHIFAKIEHLEKNSSEDWKSPKSTSNCYIHILKNRILILN